METYNFHAIVRVWSRFYSILDEASEEFQIFCWSELILYKPFRNIPIDIGLSDETMIENWRNFRYRPWHVHRAPVSSENVEDDDDFQEQPTHVEEDFEEWKFLSRLVPPNNVNVSNLHTLGRRDFDICFDWEKTTTSNDVAEEAIYFIRSAKSRGVIVENHHPNYVSPSSLAEKQ
jgi:hypothetical protein